MSGRFAAIWIPAWLVGYPALMWWAFGPLGGWAFLIGASAAFMAGVVPLLLSAVRW